MRKLVLLVGMLVVLSTFVAAIGSDQQCPPGLMYDVFSGQCVCADGPYKGMAPPNTKGYCPGTNPDTGLGPWPLDALTRLWYMESSNLPLLS